MLQCVLELILNGRLMGNERSRSWTRCSRTRLHDIVVSRRAFDLILGSRTLGLFRSLRASLRSPRLEAILRTDSWSGDRPDIPYILLPRPRVVAVCIVIDLFFA